MRIARIGQPGLERPVAISGDGTAYDLAGITDDISGSFLAADGIDRVRAALSTNALPLFSIAGQRFGSPVARPGMLLCIGLNYRQHAEETGAEIPPEPILFMKATRCVVGPNDTVLVPRTSTKTDWEVELAVVIGTTAHYLDSPDDASAHIAGYTISNDVSERAFQLERGGQWVKGKSCDTFNPLGPFLVPASDVDPQNLEMRLWVNGELRQSSNTADMIFDVNYLVWHVSQFMVLEPGDIINTGTPSGVALGLPGTPYLTAGDTVRLSIAGLGEQEQTFGAA
jgi:2-keto-4-pentenoate hydratase/2-oxohepta-3-ene-1,7-dioic acid hydratase in catechol pathway